MFPQNSKRSNSSRECCPLHQSSSLHKLSHILNLFQIPKQSSHNQLWRRQPPSFISSDRLYSFPRLFPPWPHSDCTHPSQLTRGEVLLGALLPSPTSLGLSVCAAAGQRPTTVVALARTGDMPFLNRGRELSLLLWHQSKTKRS